MRRGPRVVARNPKYVRHVAVIGSDGRRRVYAEGANNPRGPFRIVPDLPDGTLLRATFQGMEIVETEQQQRRRLGYLSEPKQEGITIGEGVTKPAKPRRITNFT